MALQFSSMQVATIKARESGSTKTLSLAGVTTAAISVSNAVAQMNKILNIGGKAVVADNNAKRVITEEAVDNG